MQRIYFVLILSCFYCLTSVFSQTLVSYDWGEAQFEETPGTMCDTTAACFLKSITRLEKIYNDEGQLDGYQLIHNKIKINNNEALERFNKVSFSLFSFNEIISLKARFISKDGNVIELDKSHLKTIEDEDGTYKLLAIEGAQTGGIIEYFWVRKGYRNLYGNHVLQTNYPKQHVVFEITCPANLRFISESYNGAPQMTESLDTVAWTRTLLLDADDIPALRRERDSFYEANLQRVEYTIAYNYGYSLNRIYNWMQIAQHFQDLIINLHPDEQKVFKKMVRKIKPKRRMTAEERIRFIENYVKTNFQLIEDGAQGLNISTISGIVNTNYASKTGYVRLFAAIFKHFNIPFELVVTCNKTRRKFDNSFDGYNFLDDFLLYFPGINNFIDPNSMYNRLGIVDNDFIGNEALYFRPVNNLLVPIPGSIPENDYTKSFHHTIADVKLNTQEPSAEYTTTHSFSGHTAGLLQPFIHYIDNESKLKFVQEVLQTDANSNRLLNWNIANDQPADWFLKPLVVSGTLSGNMLVNRAGNDLLFRIGELIGKQVEMYQEKDRVLPIESAHARSYDRILTLEIPDGYELLNHEALKMKVELILDGKVEAYFYSDYTISGKILTVKCYEGYKKSSYPAEKHAEYVNVINAAADFNKITLILRRN